MTIVGKQSLGAPIRGTGSPEQYAAWGQGKRIQTVAAAVAGSCAAIANAHVVRDVLNPALPSWRCPLLGPVCPAAAVRVDIVHQNAPSSPTKGASRARLWQRFVKRTDGGGQANGWSVYTNKRLALGAQLALPLPLPCKPEPRSTRRSSPNTPRTSGSLLHAAAPRRGPGPGL